MEINQLRYFNAVVETGQITRAAETLFVTPPTVSAAISQMENELGVRLFVRRGHKMELTPQGKRFAEYTAQILRIFRRACMELVESAPEGPEHFFVAVTASNLWADFLSAFLKAYPRLDLTCATMTETDLASGYFSDRYCFLMASEEDMTAARLENLGSLFLFRDTPAVIVSASHPFAGRSSVSPKELSEERLIWPRINHFISDKILRSFELADLPTPVISTYSQLVCETMAAQGTAVALSTLHARHEQREDLCFIPLEVPPEISWNIRLYWRKNRLMRPEEILFRDFLLDYYHVPRPEEPPKK